MKTKPDTKATVADHLRASALELHKQLEQETAAFSEAIAEARRRNASADDLRRKLTAANATLEREGRTDLVVGGLVEPETIDPKITGTLSKRGREVDDVLKALATGRRRLKLVQRRSFMVSGQSPDTGLARPRFAMGRLS